MCKVISADSHDFGVVVALWGGVHFACMVLTIGQEQMKHIKNTLLRKIPKNDLQSLENVILVTYLCILIHVYFDYFRTIALSFCRRGIFDPDAQSFWSSLVQGKFAGWS